MTGAQLKTFAEELMDNNVDLSSEHFYILLNIAKAKLEEKRLWQYLKKSDSSQTAGSGNNYTSAKTLPSDFSEDYKLMVGLDTEYFPVPFEEQYVYRNVSNRYYIDIANNSYYILGNSKGGTIYLFYKMFTSDISSSSSPSFPSRFHPLLAYYVVAIHQLGTDTDDLFARMSPANRQAAMELEQAMKDWDNRLALRAQNNQIGVANTVSEVALSDM